MRRLLLSLSSAPLLLAGCNPTTSPVDVVDGVGKDIGHEVDNAGNSASGTADEVGNTASGAVDSVVGPSGAPPPKTADDGSADDGSADDSKDAEPDANGWTDDDEVEPD